MLRSTFKNLFSRPYTLRYPSVPADLPENNRGRVEWDMQKCIWCMLCQKNCPTHAISTDKAAQTQSVTRNRCIACGRCVEVCPTQTIYMRRNTPSQQRSRRSTSMPSGWSNGATAWRSCRSRSMNQEKARSLRSCAWNSNGP